MLPTDVDLNLLRSLERLLATQSVTAAARALGVGQPAMSKRLEQLRRLTGDPLLIRRGGRMFLTPRAEGMIPLVGDAMAHVALALSRTPEFNPADATGTFTIALGGEASAALLAPLVRRIFQAAPRIDVRVRSLRRETLTQLDTGQVELAIVPDLRDDPDFEMPDLSRFVAQPIYEEHFVIVSAQRGHWSLERYAESKHVVTTPLEENDMSTFDKVLARHGLRRRVALTVPSYWETISVVAQTDLIATIPVSIAHGLAPHLHASGLPFDMAPETALLLWNSRFTTDARHRFFRKQVQAAAPASSPGTTRARST